MTFFICFKLLNSNREIDESFIVCVLCCVYAVDFVSVKFEYYLNIFCINEVLLCGCTCISFLCFFPRIDDKGGGETGGGWIDCKFVYHCNMEWVRYDDNDLCVFHSSFISFFFYVLAWFVFCFVETFDISFCFVIVVLMLLWMSKAVGNFFVAALTLCEEVKVFFFCSFPGNFHWFCQSPAIVSRHN